MPTTQETDQSSENQDNNLTKSTTLASLQKLDDEQREAIKHSKSPEDTLLKIILESIRLEFVSLRIDNDLEQETGNQDLLQEIREIAKSVFTRGQRGDEKARGLYEFKVMADKSEVKRKVIVEITLAEIQIRVKGVAPKPGRNGILKEVGEYVKHARRPKRMSEAGNVDHYMTGRFAPAREGEPLVVVDNSMIKGENGIDCQGRAIRPRAGNSRQIQFGEGVRKETLTPTKFQLVANRTGVAMPIYDPNGNLRIIDVQESVQISEVGLREGGHIAIKNRDGIASELDIEDTTVDSVGRAFKIRTSGTVTVKETIYGEVIADNIKAFMVNAEGKIVAAKDTIKVASALQASTLHAKNIIIGRKGIPGSSINSTYRALHNFTANDIKFRGHNKVLLGNDLACQDDKTICGTNLFANRQGTTSEQRSLQNQVESVTNEIRQGLALQIQKQKKAAGTNYQAILATIGAIEQVFDLCPPEDEAELKIKLNNALTDLGTLNTLSFLNLYSTNKKLKNQLREASSQLEDISPPLTMKLQSVNLNDGAQIIVSCWRDTILITRIEQEIIISREKTQEEIFRGKIKQISIEVSYNYETNKLTCSKPV